MQERKDPLLPLLAAAVSLVLVASTLHFYPRIARWIGSDIPSVASATESGDAAVPVWVCRAVEGVGLLLSDIRDDEGLGAALGENSCSFLMLRVYNFAREEPFEIVLPERGFVSPEGGEPALPAARLLTEDTPPRLRPILLGLGAVPSLRVPKGCTGQALLVIRGNPAKRTAFVSGDLSFERKELARQALARFEQRPDRKEFEDF